MLTEQSVPAPNLIFWTPHPEATVCQIHSELGGGKLGTIQSHCRDSELSCDLGSLKPTGSFYSGEITEGKE